ncbi:Fe(3+) ABC transporter substrate-binding protein [Mycoplasmatota bacterium]|nr:Fe(3+) ABC transporter substrate-binding protein [Mycoplasmatota bacterium]
MNKITFKKLSFVLYIFLPVLLMTGCQLEQKTTEEVVNIYTDRHYDTDQALYDEFTKDTGIKVNVQKASADELINRLQLEDKDTEADLLVVADAGRLYRAKDKGLLQAISSETLEINIPDNLQDSENYWYGLTVRARVMVYAKDRINPEDLSTYEDLSSDKWKGKILVRSSSNIYNQSLLASLIAINGEEEAKNWAQGIVNNMARTPEGNDRDQAKAVVAGIGDIAIMNTYYIGKLLNSADPEEVKVGEQVGVYFPNQGTTGTHINVSGAGVTEHAKNKDNAIKLLEYLSGKKAQAQYAQANYEYPANPSVEASELLKSWGDFKAQDINLSQLGENNQRAVEIFNEVDWK